MRAWRVALSSRVLTFRLILTLHAHANPLATNHTCGLIMKVNNNDINRYHGNIYSTKGRGRAKGPVSAGWGYWPCEK